MSQWIDFMQPFYITALESTKHGEKIESCVGWIANETTL